MDEIEWAVRWPTGETRLYDSEDEARGALAYFRKSNPDAQLVARNIPDWEVVIDTVADLRRADPERASVGADGTCSDPDCTCHRVGGL